MRISDVKNLQVLQLHTQTVGLPNIIRAFTGNYFNHSGTIIVKDDKISVFEATAMGAVATPFEHYVEGIKKGIYKIAFFEPDTDFLRYRKDSEERWLDFFAKYANKVEYDYANLFLHQPINITFKQWIGKKGSASYKRQICNELTYNHIYYSFTGVEDIGYKANVNDIKVYYMQCSNVIDKKNIDEFLKK